MAPPKVSGPIARFNENIKPVLVEGLTSGYGGTLQLTVHEARRLRDSLNIVLKELDGSVFDKPPAPT